MNKYYKVKVETEEGKGFWIVEANSEGWSIRQLEIYPHKVLKVPKDTNLADFKLPQGLENQPYEEITKEEFEKLWEEYNK